jgi:SNF2 family DNA or RNA helicase
MRAILNNTDIDITFQYDLDIIQRIKTIPGHRWDKMSKCWHIPVSQASKVIEEFQKDLPPDNIETLRKVNAISVFPPPPTLKSGINILPFQWHGYNFLLSRKKCFLADDTGLGKSIESILAAEELFYLKKIDKALVFAPRPLLEQWKSEILKFIEIDESEVVIIDGNKSERGTLYSLANERNTKYIIMNYEKARLEDFILDENTHRLIIFDEVTKLKNYRSQLFKSLNQIPANYKFLLSGRPLQNSPSELYTLNTLLENYLLGSFCDFKNKYAVIEPLKIYTSGGSTTIDKISGWHNLESLNEVMKDVILRRTVPEVLPELPPITNETYNIYPTDSEKEVYGKVFEEIFQKLEYEYKESTNSGRDELNILALITLEKEFLDSPKLIEVSQSDSAKKLKETFGNFDYDGSKISELKNVLEMARDGQIVIFTQFERMAHLIKEKLLTYGETCEVYGGNAPDSVRKDFLENKFRIVISTDKGAYGVNEFRNAKTLIHYDLPYNPAILDQRIGRVSGLRQSGNVLVITMTIPDQDMREAQIRSILHTKNTYFKEVFK